MRLASRCVGLVRKALSPRSIPWLLRALAIGVGYGVLNKAGALFSGSLGVSLIYPASALGVVAAQFWPWETAAGIFWATVLTPWHTSNPLWLMATYGLGNVIEALIPTRMLRPAAPGKEVASIVRFVFSAILANTLLNAALGVSAQTLAGRWDTFADAAHALWSWWVADAVAIAVVGFPILGLCKHTLFVAEHDSRRLSVAFPWPDSLIVVLVIALVAAVGGLVAARSLIAANWTMLFFLFPLGWMMVKAGLPGGAWAYGAMTAIYLASVAVHSESYRLGERPDEVLALYGNLLAYLAFVLFGGVVSSRNAELVRRLHARFQSLRSSFDAVVAALAAAIEAKDPYTEGHVERVAEYVERTAIAMGLSGQNLEVIRYAALLHDVGKIGVPESILTKPGPLTPEERKVMERHVRIGPAILERIGLLAEASPLIRYHEERYDGKTTGPYAGEFGLKGADIPLGARIIAVADAFDAMTSDRPYRKALPRERAIAELRGNAGTQFDPEVVEAFLRVISTEESTRPPRRRRRRWKRAERRERSSETEQRDS